MSTSIQTIKYKLADHMRNSLHIPDDMLSHLDIYRLKHLVVPEFKNRLCDGQVMMSNNAHDGIVENVYYDVIYHRCTPYDAKKAKEVRLSFRAAKPEFQLPNIVLVEIVIA